MLENSPFSLNQKTIVVTGASSGIGREIAIQCAGAGARILAMGRNEARLKAAVDACGEGHAYYNVDLTSPDHINDIAFFFARYAPIHGIVYAAGVSPTIPFRIMKPGQVADAFQINVFSAIELIQILLKPGIRAADGTSVVMISSVMSEVGEKAKSLYAMTKASAVALVKSLALEYADKNIRFNAISPSVVNTPLTEKSIYRQSEEAMKAVETQHPLGLGSPQDVAYAAIYLQSDASRWVTGTNMVVDGGYLAR